MFKLLLSRPIGVLTRYVSISIYIRERHHFASPESGSIDKAETAFYYYIRRRQTSEYLLTIASAIASTRPQT